MSARLLFSSLIVVTALQGCAQLSPREPRQASKECDVAAGTCKLVIEVLVAIGTDAAAMELATIGARGGSGQLRELAETALDQLAEARGLDRDRPVRSDQGPFGA